MLQVFLSSSCARCIQQAKDVSRQLPFTRKQLRTLAAQQPHVRM